MLKIKQTEIEIEDFFTLKDILIRAIEEFNFENQNEMPLINLKGNPDLYKIRIGKKKTGLVNEDYPPLLPEKKLKNTKFTVFTITYDLEHIDFDLEYSKDDNDAILDENENGLKEKLIHDNEILKKDFNFNDTINDGGIVDIKKTKKCCDLCLIF